MEQIPFSIRPFTTSFDDYNKLKELYNYAYPEVRRTTLELISADRARSAEHVCKRWLIEKNGVVKGAGGFEHWEDFYHPDKYLVHIVIDPQSQKQGFGSAIYDHVMAELSELKPQLAWTWIVRDREDCRHFAEKRGFERKRLQWNFLLDVQACETTSYKSLWDNLREDSIEVKLATNLETDPERDEKLYNLFIVTVTSINTADAIHTPTFDEFIQEVRDKSMNLNFTFVATHKDQYIGMWVLERCFGNRIFGGALGVRPEFRQRNVALSLMMCAIAQAKAEGYATLTGHTDEKNKAVLRLAEQLGFVHMPAQVMYVKRFENG